MLDGEKKLFFKKLFGFRIGQRVKVWRKTHFKSEGYWAYGTIESRVVKPSYFSEEEWKPCWKVRFDGVDYPYLEGEEKLQIVRNYRRR